MDAVGNQRLKSLISDIHTLSLKLGAFEKRLTDLPEHSRDKSLGDLLSSLSIHKNALSAAYQDLAKFVQINTNQVRFTP